MISKIMYGIKRPQIEDDKPYFSWVTDNPSESWRLFFGDHPYRPTMYEAIKAYEAIGYKCIKICVTEV